MYAAVSARSPPGGFSSPRADAAAARTITSPLASRRCSVAAKSAGFSGMASMAVMAAAATAASGPVIEAASLGMARAGPSAGSSDTTAVLTLGCGSASSPDSTMTNVSRSMSFSARRPAARIAGHGSVTASSTRFRAS